MARFIHTADLHLGRMLYGERLLDDQILVLGQLIREVERHSPDALLIAGDVFDRSVPPAEAVDALDDFLYAVVGELGVPVVMIPGNHDSADRLGFGARLLGKGLHIVSTLDRCTSPLQISDAHGPVDIYGLPFLEPVRVAHHLKNPEIRSHQDATEAMLETIKSAQPAQRSVLIAHAFVTGAEESDSERPLSLGGLDTVDAAVFNGFSAVALGHLHRPQSVGRESVQYAGSPMRYSTSEVGYTKSFSMIEIDGSGEAKVSRLPINAARDLVVLEGTLDALIKGEHPARPDDFVVAKLTDKGPVHNGMSRLRERWPNALHIERVHPETGNDTPLAGADHRQLSISELFDTFFEAVAGEPMSDDERAEMNEILSAASRS